MNITLEIEAGAKTETKTNLKGFLNSVFEDMRNKGLISSKISELVIVGFFEPYNTGSYESCIYNSLRVTIKKYCEKYNVPELNISKGREYTAQGKIVNFNESIKIFFHVSSLIDISGIRSLQELVLSVFLDEEFQKIYPWKEEFLITDSIDKVVKDCYLGIWLSKKFNQIRFNEIFPDREKCTKSARKFTHSFKRNVKKALFKYQKNGNEHKLWESLLRELNYYVNRVIEISVDTKEKVEDLEEFTKPIIEILIQVYSINKDVMQKKSPKIFELKKAIRDIFRICEIEIPIFEPHYITVNKSPINIFKDIVDTETRIVAFIDILGFSALIEEYDNDETSNILNELHEALELSIKNSFEFMPDLKMKTQLSETLDYRMFSDCVCLSLPFIDHGNDFKLQFNSICWVIRSYQLLMMEKGFYLRGGVAIGSYYSNDKMIFSGGLVKAYLIESKQAKNPIIVVSKDIVERLKNCSTSSISEANFEQQLMHHLDDPDKIFLNPFEDFDNAKKNLGLIEGYIPQLAELNSFFNDLVNPIIKPSLEKLKIYAEDEKMINLKEDILEKLKTKISQCEGKISYLKQERIDSRAYEKVLSKLKFLFKKNNPKENNLEVLAQEKVLIKLKFLEALILWSIDASSNKRFRKYKI